MSTLFGVSLLFAWRRLCQDQATCAQSEALAHTSVPAEMKKTVCSGPNI